jgi:hypothetical protein
MTLGSFLLFFSNLDCRDVLVLRLEISGTLDGSVSSHQIEMIGNADNCSVSGITSPPRGRGRPPGTFKRRDPPSIDAPPSAPLVPPAYGIRPHRERSFSHSSLINAYKKAKLSTEIAKAVGEKRVQKKSSSSMKRSKEAIFDSRFYGPENIDIMVQEINTRKLTPADLDALDLVRIWAPKSELVRTIDSLTKARDRLLKRLVSYYHFFLFVFNFVLIRLHYMAPVEAQEFMQHSNLDQMVDFDILDDDDQFGTQSNAMVMDLDFSRNDLSSDHDNIDIPPQGGVSPDLLLFGLNMLDDNLKLTEEY